MIKKVGVVGLGLIGGSMAKAVGTQTGVTVLGTDIDENIVAKALEHKAIDGVLDAASIKECDLIIIALFAQAIVDYFREHASNMKKNCIVTDCCGIKSLVCRECSKIANENDLYYIGGHPMAGIEQAGFDHSYAELFLGASMILCKDDKTNERAFTELSEFFLTLGFAGIRVTDAATHDRVIAYTSQLAHLVSAAYIKSKTVKERIGFSAGSFKDMTRVARLNEDMWTELFFDNRENLLSETENLLSEVRRFHDALKAEDRETMRRLLREGRECKEADILMEEVQTLHERSRV